VADAPIVADIALGLPLPQSVTAIPVEERVVGVVPIVYGHAHHWPTVNVAVYERYVGELAKTIVRLREEGWTVRLFTSNSVDRVALDDVLARLEPAVRESAGLQVKESASLEALLGCLRSCHAVIASRLHAVILAHRLACPVVALSFDRKVDAQMRQVGHQRFCLDIHEFDHAGLLGAFAALEANASAARASLEAYVERSESGLAGQFEAVLALADGQSAGT
jgi:polysaccharide pyruvyl transferase WcaK-like protein